MKLITGLARLGQAAALSVLVAGAAAAQTFPSKPVRLVVPAPPGGTMDVVGRLIVDEMSKSLGQPIIVDNKAGGAGMIGVHDMLGAPHDGYTVMIHISGIVSEIPFLAKPRYDPFTDIKPLVQIMRSGLVLVANPKLEAKTVAELVGWVKANPGKVNYASYTAGTISHTMGVELNAAAGLDMNHAPYKGSPPALQDLMGGQVSLMFDGPVTSVPLIKQGLVRAYAVSTPNRLAALPDVPTLAEAGYPKMTQVAWVGLFITPDVPAAVQERLRADALKAIGNQAFRDRLTALGVEPGLPLTSDELAKDLRTAYDRQASLLKSIDFKPE
jgi:tripartite-type tricarboxylate transporter receptor subunit TctC